MKTIKPGDIVRQNAQLIINAKSSTLRVDSQTTGIVIEVRTSDRNFPEKYERWQKWLGASVTVLWSNGKLTKSMAQSSLEVIDEIG
jgi:hypothetical protein